MLVIAKERDNLQEGESPVIVRDPLFSRGASAGLDQCSEVASSFKL